MENVFMTTFSEQEVRQMFKTELSEFFNHHQKQDLAPEDERLTRIGVCDLYKISFPTLHSLMKKGLPFEKVGRKTLFKRSLVDKYFSQRAN